MLIAGVLRRDIALGHPRIIDKNIDAAMLLHDGPGDLIHLR